MSSDIHGSTMPAKHRNKRALHPLARLAIVMGSMALGGAIGGFGTASILNSQYCGTSGCHKGYCYSYCGISNENGDWCYTTKTYSQSFEYVKCTSDKECNGCWKCAGSCTVG